MNSKPVTLTIQVFIPMLEKAYLLSVICQKVKLNFCVATDRQIIEFVFATLSTRNEAKGIANSKKLKMIIVNTYLVLPIEIGYT